MENDTGPRVIETALLRSLVTRMQRTHDRRRISVFVGPPGIGKTTAIEAFRSANPSEVMVIRVVKRGATGPQILQQVLVALRELNGSTRTTLSNSAPELHNRVSVEIQRRGGGRGRDEDEQLFPLTTIVFDEAQRLTNAAIDALRGYSEPHYYCSGSFPIGMIFIGNDELSLKVGDNGTTILDAGMYDRLYYKERLTYDLVQPDDIAAFAKARGIGDRGAIDLIARYFGQPRQVRSFRQLANLLDELEDEAAGAQITADHVRAILNPV